MRGQEGVLVWTGHRRRGETCGRVGDGIPSSSVFPTVPGEPCPLSLAGGEGVPESFLTMVLIHSTDTLMHTFIRVLRPPEPSTTTQVGLKNLKRIILQLWRSEV